MLRRDISVLLQQQIKTTEFHSSIGEVSAAASAAAKAETSGQDGTATCHFVKEIKVLFSAEKISYNKIIAAQLQQSGKCNDFSQANLQLSISRYCVSLLVVNCYL